MSPRQKGRDSLFNSKNAPGVPWGGTSSNHTTDYGYFQDDEAMKEQTVQSTAKSFGLTMRPKGEVAGSMVLLLGRAAVFSGIVVVNAKTAGMQSDDLWIKTQIELQETDLEPTDEEKEAIDRWLGII